MAIAAKSALLALLVAASGVLGAEWDYNDKGPYGPANWAPTEVCQEGLRQSPIDFVAPEFLEVEPFVFNYYERPPLSIKVSNNGHSAKVVYESKAKRTPTMSAGGLPGEFVFAQAHFHWGGASDRGSEHLVGGLGFPLELHLVHYNTK